ncbi:MAG TPA: hypothetical protein DEG26_11575, partial [Chloroflexi bacterium]|nr:hypothetical protein [Chloroflexota bacterium]
MNPTSDGLTVTDLHKAFGAHPVLRGVDLTVPEGAFVAVLGASGSGKTTLLRILAGFDRPDRGVVAVGGAVLKGVVFPWLLLRALRSAEVDREVEPFVGPIASLLAGVAALGVSLWLAQRLPLPGGAHSSVLVAVALFSILVGLFLIVARKKAISQVLGFLVMENGIYTFGAGLVRQSPLLVEFGVMLDVFVAVFVMG